jgi:GDPmannose 4,6-dehydratase
VVARLFNHEGPGRSETFVTSSIIRQCLLLSEGKIDQIQIGNVSAFRDWSHVEDMVEGYRILAENGSAGEVYVLGSKRMSSVLAYLLLSLSEVGYQIEALETFNGEKCVEAPLEPDPAPYLGLEFEKPRIDGLLLKAELAFDLQDRGLVVHTRQGDLRIAFEPQRYRPADVPLQISNPAKAEGIGFKVTRSMRGIVRDQLNFYSK